MYICTYITTHKALAAVLTTVTYHQLVPSYIGILKAFSSTLNALFGKSWIVHLDLPSVVTATHTHRLL